MTVAALRFAHSQDIRDIRDPNAFKTRLKCIFHEIALSVARQTKPALGTARTLVHLTVLVLKFMLQLLVAHRFKQEICRRPWRTIS